MNKSRVFFRGLLVVSVAAMLCGYVLAAEQSTQRDQDRTTQQTQQQAQQQRQQAMQQATGAQTSGMLHKTSKLIGKEVKNTQNEDLGSIYDLVLTSDHQQVSYAALSSGGTWGMGAKYYAIPWSAIRVGPQGDITMSISKSQLDQAAAFDRNNWPSQPDWQLTSATSSMRQGQTSWQQSQMGTQRQSTDPTRDSATSDTRQPRPGQTTDRTAGQRQATSDTDRATDRQTAQSDSQRQTTTDINRDRPMTGRTGAGMSTGAGAMAASRDIQYRRVSNLTGTSVRNAEGEDIGDIEDFVIDASQGQVAYTVVSFGGFWGIGEKFAAVPTTALQIQPRRNVARLDADRETLEKIAFDSDKFPDLSNREYAQRLHETFNAEPYWTVMGFVGSEQEQAATQKAWGTEGEFAKHFDAKNVKTVEGTVQSIGTFQPEGAAPGTSGGMRIRVTTSDGNLVTVYAGPQWYAQQHDFYVKPGDKISVTGSETKIGWRPVLVASEIKAEDRTLRLRSETGQPLWQAQQQVTPGQREGTMQQQRPGQGTQRPGQGTQQPGSTGQRQQGQQPNQ